MISAKRIATLLLLFCMTCLIAARAQEESYFTHTIERGQSLYSIASMYSITQADILRLNPHAKEKIYAGQTLKIPQKQMKETETFHTILSGETLFRLTNIYGVSAKEICDENPGLSAENFKAGMVIRIPVKEELILPELTKPASPATPLAEVKPRCRDMHKAKRKETIFSISREWGVSEQELIEANPELVSGLKKGDLLCIPYPAPKIVQPTHETKPLIVPTDKELFSANNEIAQPLSPIRVAVILPFKQTGELKSESARMIEFYEGFLIAVDSLKRRGISMDIHVYDSGSKTASIAPILMRDELRSMNLIIGPLYQEHVKPLASFCEQNQIRLVIPVISKEYEVFQNPWVFQINTPQSYLYSEVYQNFVRQFANANVIIIDTKMADKDKKEFIDGLKFELNQHGMPVQMLSLSGLSLSTLKSCIMPDRENVFIPNSASDAALTKIIPQLKLLRMNQPALRTAFFGYPEWQLHMKDFLNDYFELNTYFYSSFYTNNLLPSAVSFINSYHKWYTKEMLNIYPRYGMLGFDTGYYFLNGLAMYGTGFERNLHNINVVPIQNGFKFERVNAWGGFINKKVFFVHFTPAYELVKLDFDLQ